MFNGSGDNVDDIYSVLEGSALIPCLEVGLLWRILCKKSQSGPSCSKITMWLINVSLKLCSLNTAYTHIFAEKNVSSFCICKSYSHFFSKNTCELDIVLTRTFNILTTNYTIKLMMLLTTGPCVRRIAIFCILV